MYIWGAFSTPQEKSGWDIKNQIFKGLKTFLTLKNKTTHRPSNHITISKLYLKTNQSSTTDK